MCGIAALFSPSAITQTSMQSMLDIIRHRGPDDEGWVALHGDGLLVSAGGGPDTPEACYGQDIPYAPMRGAVIPQDCHLVIGHRRLSIVDISPQGHQPMANMNDHNWIVFNGEIYNYLSLREELSQLGFRFTSHTDTEVILAAYAAWGESCLDRLEGMFAFILVDRINKKLFVARDRFGIKPLYYWAAPDGTLAFASEIKQFTVLPNWHAVVNGQRAYDFLAWGIIDHTDETLFDGVFQLRPGMCASVDLSSGAGLVPAKRMTKSFWYRLTEAPFSGDFDSAAAQFRHIFRHSVSSHLRADVPVGSCLSGGLDSSSIVCMSDLLLNEASERLEQYTFSACSLDKRFDESDYINEVVKHTGCNAHYTYPDFSGLTDQLDLMTWHQDEPFGSTSIYAQWSVCKLAAEKGIKVLLDGQGADEQLAGYRGYFGARFVNLFIRMKWWQLAKEIRAMSRTQGKGLSWAIKYIADAVLPSWLRYALRKMIGRETIAPNWLNMKRLKATPIDPVRESGKAFHSIKELSFRQLTSSNLQMLLHWEDRNSMAHSIEARVPFLDRRLVEFDLGLPEEYKLSDGITKRVLRSGLSEILPVMISTRMSKLGFATPEEVWVQQLAPEYFRQAVKDAIETTGGILNLEALKVAEDVISGKRPFDFLVWRLISYANWMKCFNVSLG